MRLKRMFALACEQTNGVLTDLQRIEVSSHPDGHVGQDSAQEELVLPVSRILADLVERADMSDRIRAKNRELQVRNRQLREGRARIAALQAETEEAFMLSISLLARAAEIHDEETGNHIVRVNEYSYHLARMVGQPAEWCDEIRYSAQLHDVGKMSVDAAILRKKGPLTPEERHEMNSHPVYGHQILAAAPRLAMAAEIAMSHHERWDGKGYPLGLKEEEIPLIAQIIAVADTYDAMVSTRPYRKGLDPKIAYDEIVRHKGTQFSPKVVEAFQKAYLTAFYKV